MNNWVLQEDIRQFAERYELWEQLKGKSFLITGATGLIGSVMIRCLLELNRMRGLGLKIIAMVRSIEKAKRVFAEDYDAIRCLQLPLVDITVKNIDTDVDYIIHLASPTSGKYMEEHPVETFDLAYQSTFHLLRFAQQINVDGMIYISSLEYYGQNSDEKFVTEDMQGYVNPTSARSSYPMGKRAAEYLCYAFAKEYGIPARVARLTQTFGAGVSADDNRVFAQFTRCIINGDDIVLHTTGESAKPYCYTIDAVSAMLYILLKGEAGDAYNVASDDTYISIHDLAEFMKQHFNPAINVRVELNDNMGYAPVTKLRLSTEKLRNLGWQPQYGLKEMFERLIAYLTN